MEAYVYDFIIIVKAFMTEKVRYNEFSWENCRDYRGLLFFEISSFRHQFTVMLIQVFNFFFQNNWSFRQLIQFASYVAMAMVSVEGPMTARASKRPEIVETEYKRSEV